MKISGEWGGGVVPTSHSLSSSLFLLMHAITHAHIHTHIGRIMCVKDGLHQAGFFYEYFIY